MNKRLQVFKYVFLDWLAAFIAWGLFYLYRKLHEDPFVLSHPSEIYNDWKFWVGIMVLPLFWVVLYVMAGTYRRIYRKSRLKELGQTLTSVIIGVTLVFFILLLDDRINTYTAYYQSLLTLFSLQFGFTYVFRLILTSRTVSKIHK